MGTDKKYLVAVALLAVLAISFGVFGTVAPPLAEEGSPVQPQQGSPSESVGHFQNPPSYDSGWVNIIGRWGQYITLTHNLNTTDVVVNIVGKQSETGGEHQINMGGTGWILGWNKTWGGPGSYDRDVAYSVVQTADEGYAVVGTRDTDFEGKSVWLVKTDWAGHVQWNRTYSAGGTNEEAFAVIQTIDGGYALAGHTDRDYEEDDFWWFKTDAFGNLEWSKVYPRHPGDDYAYSIIQTSDGGYAIGGEFEEESALIKTDSSGVPIGGWPKTYDGEYIRSVVQTTDGGYALAGSKMGEGFDFWLVKIDSNGNMEWASSKTYGGKFHDEAYSVVQTVDGGYALAGYTKTYGAGGADFWLVKTSEDGTEEWSRAYGGSQNDGVVNYYEYYHFACSVFQTVDRGYALAGPTESYGADPPDFWLVKTDSTGNVQWNTTFGGYDDDWAYSMAYTTDERYAIAGSIFLSPHSGGDKVDEFWLVKSSVESGLAWIDLTNTTIALYRGVTDHYWNYVRVRIWTVKEPSWIYGDINMDGVVDAKDLYIIGRNYGKSVSLLSMGGIIGIAGIRIVRKRKQAN